MTSTDIEIGSELDRPLHEDVAIDQPDTDIKQLIRNEKSAWHFLFESTRDPVVLVNMQGEAVDINQAFLDLLHYQREEAYKMHIWDWDADFSKPEIIGLLSEIDFEGITFETRHRRKDGVILNVEISSNTTFYDDEPLLLCICRDITEKKRRDLELQELVSKDPLTGLLNRREFTYLLKDALHKSSTGTIQSSILLLDLDHFKSTNDEFGHLVGDRVLTYVAGLMKELTSQRYHVARWGGEEFTLLLPGVAKANAIKFAEQLRQAITVASPEGLPPVTASIGVATSYQTDDFNSLFKRVDDAMYLAKRSGRNCVMPTS